MSNKFKQMASERRTIEPRAAIPQVDPEAAKPTSEENLSQPPADDKGPAKPLPSTSVDKPTAPLLTERPIYLTPVDTNEQPTSRGFFMYPSRHSQLAKDLAYIEGRHPWKILDDALEEYVVKRYGRKHRRK